jgi:predicted RecA/RadA family phage recombinase
MTSLLMVTALLFSAEDRKEAAPQVEGKWRIVYAEEGGRRNNAWEQQLASVSDNTLNYDSEGKKRSLKLTFGPHQTVKAKGEKEHTGVYILGQDYLCVSLNDAKDGDKGRGKSSGSFILILRKQRGDKTEK